MGQLNAAEVLRLRARSAVSLDPSVRRSAQDDDFVGGLEYNWFNMQKTRKDRKSHRLSRLQRKGRWFHRNSRALIQSIPKTRGFRRLFSLWVQASQHAAGISDGEHSGGKVAGDDAACADDCVLTDGDAGADDDSAA